MPSFNCDLTGVSFYLIISILYNNRCSSFLPGECNYVQLNQGNEYFLLEPLFIQKGEQ